MMPVALAAFVLLLPIVTSTHGSLDRARAEEHVPPPPLGTRAAACPAAAPPAHSTGEGCAAAPLGTVCAFSCAAGYHPIGQHTCQRHQVLQQTGGRGGERVPSVEVETSYFGGRCDRLCAASAGACADGLVPLRVNSTDGGGAPCLKTTCLTADAALQNLARGNYEVWQRARHPATGALSRTAT